MSANEKKSGNLTRAVIRFFASTNLTVLLITIIAVLSFLGVTGRFGFEDVYHARYFQVALGLLFANFLFCTIDRLPASLRRIRMDMGPMAPPPPRDAYQTFQINSSDVEDVLDRAEAAAFGKTGRILNREMDLPGKNTVEESEDGAGPGSALVSFRSFGKLSLLGPHLTHFGIMAIIVGGIIGSMWGFTGLIYLKPGESTSTIITKAVESGVVDLGFTVACNDFKITYYDDTGSASDYFSDLSILENGAEKKRKTIEVNQPLYHKGYGIYQSSYGAMVRLCVRSIKDGSTVGADIRSWEPWTVPGTTVTYKTVKYEAHTTMPSDHEQGSIGKGRDLGPSIVVGKFVGDKQVDQFYVFERYPNFDKERKNDGFALGFKTLPGRHWTGLRVVRDPGLPAVWAGCALLVIGVSITFLLFHRRIWLVAKGNTQGVELSLIGKTKKGEGLFEKRLTKISENIKREFGEKISD